MVQTRVLGGECAGVEEEEAGAEKIDDFRCYSDLGLHRLQGGYKGEGRGVIFYG